MIYNRIPVVFGPLNKVTGPRISYQYDIVQFLIFADLELPEYYTVDFCNEGDTQTKPMVGSAEGGVQIPDEYLQTGKPIKAYLIVTGTDEGASETRKELTLPVSRRPQRTDITPTPEEQLVIDQLIGEMNDAVEQSEENAEDSEAWAVGERGGVPVEEGDETYENNAKFYAGQSEHEAEVSAEKAVLSESWAVGGTGTRQGEDNDNAKHYAELAAQHADESGYAWFDVNDEDGHMYIYISDNLSEDVSFAINEATGHLMITYN